MSKTITINYDEYLNIDRELKDLRLRIKSYEKQIPILIIKNWNWKLDHVLISEFENTEKASQELQDIYFNFEQLKSELDELKSENNHLRKELNKPWYKRLF